MAKLNDIDVQKYYEMYGSVRKAANALGMSKTVFGRQLKAANDKRVRLYSA